VIQIAAGTKVYLACRPVGMRYGFDGLAARSYMSMPLLVRLTDSEVQVIDGALPQTSDSIEDGCGVLEEVGSSRLSIDEQALLPDLHIDSIHRDI